MRKLGLVVASLLAVAALLPLGGAAQGQDNCQLTLSAGEQNPGTGNFSVGEMRTYIFTIENTGDLQARAEVFISPPPSSWDWPDRVASVDLGAGASTERTIEVTFQGSADRDATLEVRLQNVQCRAGPLTGFSVQGSSNGPQSLALSHAPLPAPAEDGFPWAWVVFGAIIAGTVVGVPVVYRSRGARIDATCEEAEKDVIAGRGTSFPITLKNKSGDPVPVKLEVADVQEGWSALTTLPDLELGAKETRTVYMMVRAPEDAKPGDLCVAKLRVKPEGGSEEMIKTLTRVDQPADAEEPEAAQADEDEAS